MNINVVSGVSENNFKGVKKSFIQLVESKRPLSQYTQDYLVPQFYEVEKMARGYGAPVRIAQLANEKLLVNVGNLTKVVETANTLVTDIPMILSNIIKANSIASNRGLKSGFEYLA